MSDLYAYCYTCDQLIFTVTSGQMDTIGHEFNDECPNCGDDLTMTDGQGYDSIMSWGDTAREWGDEEE